MALAARRTRHLGWIGGVVVLALGLAGCGGGDSADAPDAAPSSGAPAGGSEGTGSATRLGPEDIVYLGAFRLPGGEDRPQTFAYGGNAMTFNPARGSLFVTGHDRLPYGELPDGSQVAEISVPTPVIAGSAAALPIADFVQSFHDAAHGLFQGLDEIPRIGLQYLDHPATGPALHLAWGQHLQDPGDPTHAMLSAALGSGNPRGPWWLAGVSSYSVNGYMFEIPAEWANAHTGGRVLATGRFKDGGWSGKGPALYAYVPWLGGGIAADGATLAPTRLLQYESSESSESVTANAMTGYQHPDEWEGGAWVTTASGKAAVVFVGTKSVGNKYWYGWVHPGGPELPCVETEFLGQFPLCWNADGTQCPASDLGGCNGHNDYRGWWSTRFVARMIFYDPSQLAQVAAGTLASSAPQPYAWLDIDSRLFLTGESVEPELLGHGGQRRYRIGDTAFDRATGRLFVLELFADGAKPGADQRSAAERYSAFRRAG
jgi:hypothetical protein